MSRLITLVGMAIGRKKSQKSWMSFTFKAIIASSSMILLMCLSYNSPQDIALLYTRVLTLLLRTVSSQ